MTKPVVVGVSPTSGSPTALRWAAEEAQLRDAPLRAVLAWRPPRAPAAPAGRPPASGLGRTRDPASDAERTLHGMIRTTLGAGRSVDCLTVRGAAVPALLRAATDAQLLVLGPPRHGLLASVRAALVAPQLLQPAPCPIVVVPA